MSKYLYTGSALPSSTCQRNLARIVKPDGFVCIAHPFTLWTDDDLSSALFYPNPTVTAYKAVWRAPNNRLSRRFAKVGKAEILNQ